MKNQRNTMARPAGFPRDIDTPAIVFTPPTRLGSARPDRAARSDPNKGLRATSRAPLGRWRSGCKSARRSAPRAYLPACHRALCRDQGSVRARPTSALVSRSPARTTRCKLQTGARHGRANRRANALPGDRFGAGEGNRNSAEHPEESSLPVFDQEQTTPRPTPTERCLSLRDAAKAVNSRVDEAHTCGAIDKCPKWSKAALVPASRPWSFGQRAEPVRKCEPPPPKCRIGAKVQRWATILMELVLRGGRRRSLQCWPWPRWTRCPRPAVGGFASARHQRLSTVSARGRKACRSTAEHGTRRFGPRSHSALCLCERRAVAIVIANQGSCSPHASVDAGWAILGSRRNATSSPKWPASTWMVGYRYPL